MWSTTFDGGSDSDALHEITMFQGHLFAVGTNADTATLIEPRSETGDVLQTLQNERGSGTDEYRGIATDDTHIYAGGTLGSDGTIDTYYYAPMVNDVLDFDDLTTSRKRSRWLRRGTGLRRVQFLAVPATAARRRQFGRSGRPLAGRFAGIHDVDLDPVGRRNRNSGSTICRSLARRRRTVHGLWL
ncbi:MAG: hypothetical protein M5U33_07170 [Pseudorhodoplanes sp.]|nr:hypothetical protein [Pseudorhodoplanes sp.]